ncbi:tol-pal system YbgF family protein [Prosthecobacter sp.]|jgi:tetratricopeptide (TPR) repeat protein|uniref:tol-pal system YbgF family protein n=1 Tax=Prosthecobacter sp. TaxID=1965333 RepID=UPI0037CC64D7
MHSFARFLLVFAVVAAGSAFGQAIVLKDGNRVFSSEFSIQDGKIVRTVQIGENKATTILEKKNIDSLEWPYPAELTESADLLAKGKTEEAIAVLKKGRDFFENFEGIEGNWYIDIYFAYIEALNQGGKFDEVVKSLPSLRALKLTDAQKMRLRIIQLDIERQTSSDYAGILVEAQSILKETDDSAIGASLWALIADVHTRKKEWEKALLAYLRIPVFYGTQMQRVPEAELNAAKILIKMKRYEDANAFLARISESYPGSPVAESATKEKAAIAGMKNVAEEEADAAAADGKTDAAKPKEGEPAKPTDSKPKA